MVTLLHLLAFTPSHIVLLQKSLYIAMGYSACLCSCLFSEWFGVFDPSSRCCEQSGNISVIKVEHTPTHHFL